jgi:hypothetical protein
MSVRPSVRIEQLGFLWTDFHEICYSNVFRKSVEKTQDSLKYDKNNGHINEDVCTFKTVISLSSSHSERCVRKNCETKEHPFYFQLFPKVVPFIIDIMLKNIIERGRPQMAI